MRLYTRTGDGGSTYCAALRERVSKAHPLIEVVGTLDEAESALGLAQSLLPQGMEELSRDLEWCQNLLFRVGFTLAGKKCVSEEDVEKLERLSDRYSEGLEPLFVLHGGHPASAALSLARAVVRRLERNLVRAVESGAPVAERNLVLRAVNRLSDALYAMAMHVNRVHGITPARAGCD